ncbi:hypothetical protein TRVL_03928 [Trypanosoma vivax]|nr:hypothetical protein TRVL_03928 [Trypanosoma vivax]
MRTNERGALLGATQHCQSNPRGVRRPLGQGHDKRSVKRLGRERCARGVKQRRARKGQDERFDERQRWERTAPRFPQDISRSICGRESRPAKRDVRHRKRRRRSKRGSVYSEFS